MTTSFRINYNRCFSPRFFTIFIIYMSTYNFITNNPFFIFPISIAVKNSLASSTQLIN